MSNAITTRIANTLRNEAYPGGELVALLTAATLTELIDFADRSESLASFIATSDRRAIRAASLELAHRLDMGLYTLKVDGRAWTRDATRAHHLTVIGCEMGHADCFDPSDRTVIDGLTFEGHIAGRREGCEELTAELAPLRIHS